MGTFSDNLQSVSNTLLTTYGETISFVRWSTSEYNTTTGAVDPMTSTSFTGKAHPSSYRIEEIDGQTIQVNDIQAIVYTTTEPLIEDQATIDTVNYRVMNVEKLRAQGEDIVYLLQLRV
jgi:hypothetical protein